MYSRVLVALDGSPPSITGGDIALAVCGAGGTADGKAEILACHVYSAQLHGRRFVAMEPGLPAEYHPPRRRQELRQAHDTLIGEGFEALSAGYLDDLLTAAAAAAVPAEPVVVEGRSYRRILEIAAARRADLIVLGASGLGTVGDGLLGGTTTRVLRHATCDVLVARRALTGRPVLAGIDGSDHALAAGRRAAQLAGALGNRLQLAAAYDPDFHTQVFGAMASSLSDRRQQEVGLAQQKQLHDSLINDGLATLYEDFLREAESSPGVADLRPATSLVEGKAYRALLEREAAEGADLLVIGRFGHHHENVDLLGANAEAVVRLAKGNVLVTCGRVSPAPLGKTPPSQARRRQPAAPADDLHWRNEALAQLERVPAFARPMARRAVERSVRESGGREVTSEAFEAAARQYGMGV